MSDNVRRCLILDFDGVLVDTEPLHFAGWQQAFDTLMGIRIEDNYHLLVGLSLEQIYQLWAGSKFDLLTPDLRQQLLALKNRNLPQAGRRRASNRWPEALSYYGARAGPVGIQALVTRSLRMRLHRTLDIIRMPALFDVILGSEDAVDPLNGSQKPCPCSTNLQHRCSQLCSHRRQRFRHSGCRWPAHRNRDRPDQFTQCSSSSVRPRTSSDSASERSTTGKPSRNKKAAS